MIMKAFQFSKKVKLGAAPRLIKDFINSKVREMFFIFQLRTIFVEIPFTFSSPYF